MHNQSKRESIVRHAKQMIEQNNDEIEKLRTRISETDDDVEKRKIADEIKNLEQSTRRLSLRLKEPVQSMILEYQELLRKGREAATEEEKKHFSELSYKKSQEILIETFGGDKNIGRFNSI